MPLFPALLAAVFMSTLAMRMTDPLVPILAQEFQVRPGDIALFATAYAIPYGLSQLVLGPLGDHFGKTTVIKAALFLMALGILASSLAPTYPTMVATRAVSGCVAGGIIPLSLASISDLVPIERRQLVLARVLLAAISGQIMGAFVTGLIATSLPWRSIFVVYAGACVAIVVLLQLAPAIPRNHQGSSTYLGALKRFRTIALTRAARPLLATVLTEGLLFYGFLGQMPAYLAQIRGFTSAEIGAVVAGYGLGGALYSALFALLIRMTNGYGLMRLGGLLGGLAIGLSILPLGTVAYGALTMLAGFGFYSIHVGMQTRASELDPTARGASISLVSATLFIGNGLGPWLLGLMISATGYSATFGLVGVGALALGLSAAVVFRRVDEEAQ